MQAPPQRPTIPIEITTVILKTAHAEAEEAENTLRSCALVSRQFCSVSQALLFRRITLSSRSSKALSTKALYQLLINESEHVHIPLLVHELKINIDHSIDDSRDDSTLHLILLRLSTTGNLRSLAIHSSPFPYVGWLCWETTLPSLVFATRRALQSEALTNFDLRGFWFRSFALLNSLLRSAKGLQELSLYDLSVTNWHSTNIPTSSLALTSANTRRTWFNSFAFLCNLWRSAIRLKAVPLDNRSVANHVIEDTPSIFSSFPAEVEDPPYLRTFSISAARERGRSDPTEILAWLAHSSSINLKKVSDLSVKNVEDFSFMIKLAEFTTNLRSLSLTFSKGYKNFTEISAEPDFSNMTFLFRLSLSLGGYYTSAVPNPQLWLYNAFLTFRSGASLEILEIECHVRYPPEFQPSEELDLNNSSWRSISTLLAGGLNFPLLKEVNLMVWLDTDSVEEAYKIRLLDEMSALVVDKVNFEVTVHKVFIEY